MRWTAQEILRQLRRRHQKGAPIAYRILAQTDRPLVSAATYHFGSFKEAVEQAGIDYQSVSRKPHWTKARIIQLIKSARRKGQDLSWTSVVSVDGPLRRAAFVAVQKRMWGGWPRALQAAGVDGDESRRYLTWDKTVVVADLKQRHADGHAMNSSAVQAEDPALHAAAIRYFGAFDRALKSAGLNVKRVRLRRKPQR